MDVAPPEPEATQTTLRLTIQDAIDAFLAKCKNRSIAPNTLAKYHTFTNQLSAYCVDRGCIYIDQLTVTPANARALKVQSMQSSSQSTARHALNSSCLRARHSFTKDRKTSR